MDDFERVNQEIVYQLDKGKILSYYIENDFSHNLKMIETIDRQGNVTWRYFDKKTGMERPRGV